MAVKWTGDQERVIAERGSNMLVSAAAGSGKTAVLVARIMSLITEGTHPMDIDELLIVTFTRAAAGEMQERIAKAIAEARGKDPDNEHLERQAALIHNACITTIDGFCAQVVRDYGHTIDLVPGARVADEGEMQLLEKDVLDTVLEEAHAEGENDPAFGAFVETFATGKSDRPLEEIILRVYRRAVSEPDPAAWLARCRKESEAVSPEALENTLWMKEYLADIREDIFFARERAAGNLALVNRPDGPSAYRPVAEAEYAVLEALLEAEGYEAMREVLNRYQAVRLSTAKPKAGEDPALRDVFKENRAEVTALIKELSGETLAVPLDQAAAHLAASAGPVVTLTALAERYMEVLGAEKRRRNLMDFSDLEHFALKILRDENGRTAAARELSRQFREVMVDEYQDSNYLQEAILTAVSRIEDGEPDYFCVGDVKQSIYSFRQARPELFMEKFDAWRPVSDDGGRPSQAAEGPGAEDSLQAAGSPGEADGLKAAASPGAADGSGISDGIRIDLRRNFRSRREVLSFANGIFSQIMRREVGGVAYGEDVSLVPGAVYPEKPMRPGLPDGSGFEAEIIPVLTEQADDTDEAPDGSDELTPKELEACAIAQRILEMVGHEQISDGDAMRPVEYRDIVILLRTMDGWADIFAEVLERYRIPAYSTARSGYFGAKEVQAVLSFLTILDNPYEDISLAAVLLSPFAGLTADELARIRVFPGAKTLAGGTERKDIFLYTAVRHYASAGTDAALCQKLAEFFGLYDSLKNRAGIIPLHELITALLNESGYLLYASSMPGGAQRELNLRMLSGKAVEYENTSYTGLFNFVRYIRNLQKQELDFGELSTISEADNVVRIISIHKSKGLEYPVVFVSGLGKRFNRQEQYAFAAIHPDMGIATDYIDYERRVRVPTLRKAAIRARLLKDSMGEELRVLYVALTRAKQKLILTGTLKNEQALSDLSLDLPLSETFLPAGYIMHAKTPFELILPAADRMLRRSERESGQPPLVLRTAGIRDIAAAETGHAVRREAVLSSLRGSGNGQLFDAAMRDIIEERFHWQYPYAGRENIPVEVSVSELKHRVYEELMNLDPETEAGGQEISEGAWPRDGMSAGESGGREMPGEVWSRDGMSAGESGAEDSAGEPGFIPEFMRDKEASAPLTGASRGTAYHAVMERLVFPEPASDPAGYEEEAARQITGLAEQGILDSGEAAVVRPRDIASFLESGLGRRMAEAAADGRLMREQAFVLEVPASEVRPEWPADEPVFVQGIIDAFFYEGDGIVLVDYKTDRVRSGAKLMERYRVQLKSYAEALERVTGRQVREKYLWSFHLSEAVSDPER